MSTSSAATEPRPAVERDPALDAPARRSFPFWAKIFIGLAAGILLGFVARVGQIGWLGELLTTVGTVFVSLLKAVVVPLVFFALVVSINNLRAVKNATDWP